MARKRKEGRDRRFTLMWSRGQVDRAYFETKAEWEAFKRWREKYHPVAAQVVDGGTSTVLPIKTLPPASVHVDKVSPVAQASHAPEEGESALDYLAFLCPEHWPHATWAEKKTWEAMWKTSLKTDSAGVAERKRIMALLDARYADVPQNRQLSLDDYAKAIEHLFCGEGKVVTYEERAAENGKEKGNVDAHATGPDKSNAGG